MLCKSCLCVVEPRKKAKNKKYKAKFYQLPWRRYLTIGSNYSTNNNILFNLLLLVEVGTL